MGFDMTAKTKLHPLATEAAAWVKRYEDILSSMSALRDGGFSDRYNDFSDASFKEISKWKRIYEHQLSRDGRSEFIDPSYDFYWGWRGVGI